MKKLALLILMLVLLAPVARGAVYNCPSGPTCTSSINANASSVRLQIPPNTGTVVIQVSGTFSGTLQFEQSVDGGVSFVNASGAPQPSGASVSSTTSTGTWRFVASGMTHFQVRSSAWTSGTANIVIQASQGSASQGGSAFNASVGPSYQDVLAITAPTNPASGYIRLYGDSGTGNFSCLTSAGASCVGGGAPAFSAITAGTNTTAAMICGTGCSFGVSGSGTNAATSLTGIANGSVAVGTATALSVVTGLTMSAATGMRVPAPTGNGNALNLIGSADAGHPDILNLSLPGSATGTGDAAKVDYLGGLTAVSGQFGTGSKGTVSLGTLTVNGATSGSASITATATGGTLNVGSTNATVTSAGALTVASCNGCGLPFPDQGTKIFHLLAADANTSTLLATNNAQTVIGSSPVTAAVAGNSTTLPLVSMQTKVSTPTSGDAAGERGNINFPTGHGGVFTAYIKIDDQASGSLRWWAGVMASETTAAASDTPNQVQVAFRYSTGASDTKIMCVVGTNGSPTVTNSNVTPDANTHYIKIVDNSTTGHILFYWDGSQVCDNTLTLPSAGTYLAPGVTITTLTSAQRKHSVGFIADNYNLY